MWWLGSKDARTWSPKTSYWCNLPIAIYAKWIQVIVSKKSHPLFTKQKKTEYQKTLDGYLGVHGGFGPIQFLMDYIYTMYLSSSTIMVGDVDLSGLFHPEMLKILMFFR